MLEPILDSLIVLFGAWITWRFLSFWRRRGSRRSLMLAAVFGVIALSHAMELFFIHIFGIQAPPWLTDEVTLNIVLLLALIGTAAALSGAGWRGAPTEKKPEQDRKAA